MLSRVATGTGTSRPVARRLADRVRARALAAVPSCSPLATLASASCPPSASQTSSLLTPLQQARFKSTAAVAASEEPSSSSTTATTTGTTSTSTSSSKSSKSSKPQTPFVSTAERKYEFFENVTLTDSGVALIKFDCPGKPVNTISFKLAQEAKTLWQQEVEANDQVKAVVFGSAKPNMFVAGADIFDIQAIDNKQDLLPLIEDGVNFFQSLKAKGVPLVAAIDGPALGGGLEWALWCDYRVCTDSSKTKMGLPEVKLGLLPGFGGTQNLPALVGLQAAMDMMLTGKDIRPDKAKKMGLVDLVVAPQSLEAVAIQCAEGLANGSLKKKPKKQSYVNQAIEGTSVGRNIMWKKVEEMVQKNTNGNYPSPTAIIQCVKYGLEHPHGNLKFKNEREQFVKLAESSESAALIGIFDGMTQMKKHSYGADAALPVHTVAVLGAGLMGAGIAQVSAEQAKMDRVLLKDRDDASVARGVDYLQTNWRKKVSRRRMSDYQYNTLTSRVVPLTDTSSSLDRHWSKTDMVLEAVFEDLTLKQQIVANVEATCPDHTIFATNTSAIPISSIAANAQRPENIIGMHYFSPVPSMPLLEIIPHAGTSDRTIATAYEVGARQGKTCVVVKDVPGFYVNRCLGPYLVEVSALVRDGVGLEQLDTLVTDFGMPVGPITLADEVGIDVASHVATFLSQADLGVRMQGGDVTLMQQMIQKGWLGKKAGQGFYTYAGKKKTINAQVQAYIKEFAAASSSSTVSMDKDEILDRLITRFVNEAAKCLEDEIIADPVVGDIGMVFGTGFAPFRGGPFRYLDQVGVAQYVDRMHGLADRYGPQFEPCQLLKDYASADKKFHG